MLQSDEHDSCMRAPYALQPQVLMTAVVVHLLRAVQLGRSCIFVSAVCLLLVGKWLELQKQTESSYCIV